MKEVLLAIIFIFFVVILISIIYCYIKIDVSYFDIENDKIDKNIKILFLSDLHNRNIYRRLKNIINKEKVDIIICGGDMINEGLRHMNNFMKLLPLFKNYKTYYTFGNHEEVIYQDRYKEYKKYKKYIQKTDVILLNNKSEHLSKNICIYGLSPSVKYYRNFGKKSLNDEVINYYIGKIDKSKFNLLVSHTPLEFDSYVNYGVDLVLCGHLHGGVIKLPKLGGLLSPDYTLFPKYSEGIHKKEKTSMIVSRGLGFSTKIPFRIFDTPEVVVINLKKK